ncbi:PHP domain-containing protein [Candidatus Omnitrophota bacterium]
MNKLADLHLHTFFSDGTFSPEQLVEQAKIAGLCCIAVTDHDCVDGIQPAKEAAGDSLEVIAGIELSAEIDSKEIHVLGYFIDLNSARLKEEAAKIQIFRVKRVHGILEKLRGLGIDLSPDAVFTMAGKGTVGRLHIAKAMVAAGIVSNVYEAFSKYISNDGPAYVGKFSLTPQEAIRLIVEAKGIPVLAHPHNSNCDELIPSFARAGLRGLEVFYPEYSQAIIGYYQQIAQKYGLLVTGGSDCHGEAKPKIRVGKINIPYELVEEMKKELNG